MGDALAAILGFATFALIYSWPLTGVVIGMRISERIRPALDDRHHRSFGFWTMVLGAVAFWLIWRYALPDWWIGATPLIVSD